MSKKGLDTWGFNIFPTDNIKIFRYEQINCPRNKMTSYMIFSGVYVLFIDFREKYKVQNSDYEGRYGIRIGYGYEGNYFTYINDTKVLITTREIFVGKSIPKSRKSFCTSDITKAFNIVIAPKELKKEESYYEIVKKFLQSTKDTRDIGFCLKSEELINLANQLIDALRNEDEILISLKTLELIYKISREKISETRKKYYKEEKIEIIEEIEKFLRKNLEKNIDLDLIAEKFKISKSNFNNKFMRKFQYTPIKYLNNLRMIRAEELLTSTNMRIIDIAEEVGFHDSSNFTRTFRKFSGMSPSKYRKNNR